jgi:hypothetical protein
MIQVKPLRCFVEIRLFLDSTMIQVSPVHCFFEILPFLDTTMIQVNPAHCFVEILPFLDTTMREVSLLHSLICCVFKCYINFLRRPKPGVDGVVTCDGMDGSDNELRKGGGGSRGEIFHAVHTGAEVHLTSCTIDTGRSIVLTTPTSCAALGMSWRIPPSLLCACLRMS